MNLKDAATEFLAHQRIAVAGVSRSSDQAANLVYTTLRDRGYEVYAVNPAAEHVEGDVCYPGLGAIPVGVDGVVIATHPDVTPTVVQECVDLGIPRVWMHRSFGTGSVSPEAVQLCQKAGIDVIPGGCPMMFFESADVGHRCMRWFLGITGKLPTVDTWSAPPPPVDPRLGSKAHA